MDYEEAPEIGAPRSEMAAELLGQATGLLTQTVCAVKGLRRSEASDGARAWAPVGKESFGDVSVFERKEPSANVLLVLVDAVGVARAAVRDFMSVLKAVQIAKSLRFPVSRAGRSYLREALEAEDLTEQVRGSTLRIDM